MANSMHPANQERISVWENLAQRFDYRILVMDNGTRIAQARIIDIGTQLLLGSLRGACSWLDEFEDEECEPWMITPDGQSIQLARAEEFLQVMIPEIKMRRN